MTIHKVLFIGGSQHCKWLEVPDQVRMWVVEILPQQLPGLLENETVHTYFRDEMRCGTSPHAFSFFRYEELDPYDASMRAWTELITLATEAGNAQ